MLVLARKEGESFLIQPADDINPDMTVQELFSQPVEFLITQIKGGQVRVGIKAPRVLVVIRKELDLV